MMLQTKAILELQGMYHIKELKHRLREMEAFLEISCKVAVPWSKIKDKRNQIMQFHKGTKTRLSTFSTQVFCNNKTN